MKNYKTLFILLLIYQFSFSQTKEWNHIIALLQEEASYFANKKGYLKLLNNTFTDFQVVTTKISKEKISSEIRLSDRFNNQNVELILEETFLFYEYSHPQIDRVSIDYNSLYFFDDFPDTQFLLIELSDETPSIHKTISKYVSTDSNDEKISETEELTIQLRVIIRSDQRKKILEAIDAYQLKMMKEELDNNRNH